MSVCVRVLNVKSGVEMFLDVRDPDLQVFLCSSNKNICNWRS
jgi:hypothetical protein